MTNEIEKLKTAFENEVGLSASKPAKDLAMRAALDAFEEKNAVEHQGNWISKRLKGQGNELGNKLRNKIIGLLTLSEWRKKMKLSYILAGGTSIAVLTLAIANTGQFRELIQTDQVSSVPLMIDQSGQSLDKNVVSAPKAPGVKVKKDRVVAEQKPTAKPQKVGNLVKQENFGRQPIPPSSPSTSRAFSPVAKLKQKQPISSGDQRLTSGLYSAPNESGPVLGYSDRGRDKFTEIIENPVKFVTKTPVSTFSIDVDTAAYSFMRASINRNVLPTKDAVRVEEFINYFPYEYDGPESKDTPFKANVTVMPTPWNKATKLVHIGIKGYDIQQASKPKSNLVFLLDTSGSMNAVDKLPLLKNSFKLLLSTLSKDDTVSIVTYAGSAGVVLEPTKANNKSKILAALDRLNAGGSTAGGRGIKLAYQLAQSHFDKKGVNRVILATDGDFNVGIRNQNELKSFVERKRKSGVMLSVLGFGMGNYNDALMQTLAQNGNGNAAYIDSLSEARKVLVQEASSSLFTIAKDVKIQMEFNPQTVNSYRLIGYETRKLKREDFNNDKVDAGDIGSGHTVTAIYEIVPVGSEDGLVDQLRYGATKSASPKSKIGEYGFLKLRYKLPTQSTSRLMEAAIKTNEALENISEASQSVRFSTAVAAYGQLLRGGKYTKAFSYDDVIKLASGAKGKDLFGYRSEFINLVRLAKLAAGIAGDNN